MTFRQPAGLPLALGQTAAKLHGVLPAHGFHRQVLAHDHGERMMPDRPQSSEVAWVHSHQPLIDGLGHLDLSDVEAVTDRDFERGVVDG